MPATPRMYLVVVHRPLPAAPLVERRRYLVVAQRPIPAEPRKYLIVLPRSMPAATCRYLIVAPRPSPAALLLCIAGTIARGAARCALQTLDRGAQVVARGGGARCASQGCVYLSCCPGRFPRRRSLCVKVISSLRPAFARGAAQVVERGAQAVARGGARCALRVLGAACWFSQVLDLGAQVLAAAPRTYLIVVHRPLPAAPRHFRSSRRTTLLMCSGKK